jgi:hypothetical protein
MPRGGVRLTLRQGCSIIPAVCCRGADMTRTGDPCAGLSCAEATQAREVYHGG